MKKSLALFAVLLAVVEVAWCGITVTAETAGAVNTTVPGAVTYDFEGLPTGLKAASTIVAFGSVTGTYNQLYISAATASGGATNSKFAVACICYNFPSYTLTLDRPVNYFGLWWSAGDIYNHLDFYRNGVKIATFDTSTAFNLPLPSGYYGNPNTGTFHGQFSNQPYAYLNFFGTAGTTFDRIDFYIAGDNAAGFESDNHAIAENATVPNGAFQIATIPTVSVAVPALSLWAELTLVALLLAAGAILLERRRRHQSVL